MNKPQLGMAICIGLTIGIYAATAQDRSAAAPTTPQAPAARGNRPPTPTRDPHTPGYVEAKELPDGTIPSINDEGNFIIGPTHNPAPDMTVQESVPHGAVHNFEMSSADSKI